VAKQIPKISIVTPSFNQGEFLEDAIRSVVTQNYPNLEYVIVDGGSTDGSVDIITKYEKELTYWISEPDAGQYDAINRGFSKTTGDIMAWLNSDDKYTPWAFAVVGDVFSALPEIEWLTTLYPLTWDECGRATKCFYQDGYSRQGFFRGENLPGSDRDFKGFIQQESTFWRRSLWERAGGYVDTSSQLATDFELWARFYKYTDLYAVATPLGGFREHPAQKTAYHLQDYIGEAKTVLLRCAAQTPYKGLDCFIRSRLLGLIPKRIAAKLRLIDEPKVCVYKDDQHGWKISRE